MKKLSAICCALFFASSAAIAADVPATKPSYSTRVPTPTWAGFYVGAIGGYGWNSLSVKELIATTIPAEDDPTTITTPFGQSARANGLIFGAQVGADFELPNRIVVGIAGDWMRSNADARASIGEGDEFVAISFDAKSIWTVRGRFGYAMDNILIYGTGGFAAARSTIGLAVPILSLSLKDDVNHTGWVAGVGAEIRLAAHWRIGAEYRYLSFGKARADFFAENLVGDEAVVSIPAKWRAHQALVSLNYQF